MRRAKAFGQLVRRHRQIGFAGTSFGITQRGLKIGGAGRKAVDESIIAITLIIGP